MKATTRNNLKAIFGTPAAGQERACKITSGTVKVAGKLCVYSYNAADLWVWTNNPRHCVHKVIARIDLRSATAMDQLAASGVVI